MAGCMGTCPSRPEVTTYVRLQDLDKKTQYSCVHGTPLVLRAYFMCGRCTTESEVGSMIIKINTELISA